MAELSVPLLNRLVEAMFPHADFKADQNIWDLARAAEEVMREVKGEQLVAAYGGPKPKTLLEFTEEIKRQGTTGRMQMNPVPFEYARAQEPPQPPPNPDYAAQLGEVERRLSLKAPQYTGDTATKVDALAQDFQAADKQVREQNKGIERLKREMQELRETAQEQFEKIRTLLDPNGEHEGESLIDLVEDQMRALTAAKEAYRKLQERIGTEIETNSAEMLRRVLGAGENETLGHAAKRVATSAEAGWKQYAELSKRENDRFHQLDTRIRQIVAAVDESESDDHYMPGQPTIDAVRRVVDRLVMVDRHPDGSRRSAHEVLGNVQCVWDGVALAPFSWERDDVVSKPAYEGPRYVVRKSSGNPDFDDWAVWDKQTGDWFTAVDVGSKNEADRRAAGLNETEEA